MSRKELSGPKVTTYISLLELGLTMRKHLVLRAMLMVSVLHSHINGLVRETLADL